MINYPPATPWHPASWGEFLEIGENLYLVDYKHNALYSLKNNPNRIIRNVLYARADTELFYFRDSMFYFGKTRDNFLDSLQLHFSEFEKVNIPVYEPENHNGDLPILFSAIALASGGILLVARRKKKKEKKEKTLKEDEQPQTSHAERIVFDENEVNILKLIATNSLQDKFTSLDEINKVLGVASRSPEIQKKHRSDILNSATKKYYLATGIENVIQKRRTDFDKRSYEYFVDKLLAENVLKVANTLPK